LNNAIFHSWLQDVRRRRPLVMGILNVTPDSFSDGGRYTDVGAAVDRAAEMAAAGADVIDVGGESTRPGSTGVPSDEQLRRVLPVIEGIRNRLPVVISIDTMNARVADAALNSGANLVNDVSAGHADRDMFGTVAAAGAAIVLMHMQGTPATMQQNPVYADVVREVKDYLRQRANAAAAAGVDENKILLDPGIGFGKTPDHNLALLRETRSLAALGRPLVIGTSRKGFIGQITGESDAAHRLMGTAATVAWSIANGAAIVRVHDVPEMTRVVRMTQALIGDPPPPPSR
jgi:dihydropteroate synthase